MNRRSVLKVLAGLPLFGWFFSKEAKAKPLALPALNFVADAEASETFLMEKTPFTPQTIKGPLEPEKMADLLIANLRETRKKESEAHTKWAIEHGELIVSEPLREKAEEDICRAMCKYLNDWSLSAPYDRDHPNCTTPQVRFDVMTAPVNFAFTEVMTRPDGVPQIDIRVEALKAQARRLRAIWNAEAAQDVQAFLGDDPYDSMCDAVGQQIALEIQMEIRHAARDWTHPDTGVLHKGNPVRIYALYVPPHMPPSYLDPKDFSIRRGFRMRYAKAHERSE